MNIGKTIASLLRERLGQTSPSEASPAGGPQRHFPARYGLGALTALAMLVVCLSGIYMALFFQPDPVNAAKSVEFIESSIALGAFARAAHRWGAFVVMLFMALHIMVVLWRCAYRAPRELNWILGIFLFVLTFFIVVSGFMLPWDFKAYWTVKTMANWRASLPLFSGVIDWIIFSDAQNNLVPVGRWFALHTLVLPVLVALCLAGHWILFRRHGPAAHEGVQQSPVLRWGAALLTIALILGLAQFGTIRQDAADPITTSSLPQPGWLLLLFFQVTRYCQDATEMIGVFWGPMAFVVGLSLLVLVDKGGKWKKQLQYGIAAVSLVCFVGLGVVTWHTGSTVPVDSCAACHKKSFGEEFAAPPQKVTDFSERYDNKWLALHYRHPQYFWMMDANVPAW